MSDPLSFAQPQVTEECFGNYASRSRRDLEQSMNSIRMTSVQLCTGLHTAVRTLLKKETRSSTIKWLGSALDSNMSRAQMHTSSISTSSDGFFINLNWTLLKLCEPFIDPNAGKAWPHLDADYVLVSTTTDFSKATKLLHDDNEDKVAREAAIARRGGKQDFHFICECFFLTLKSLHLGLVQAINHMISLLRSIHHLKQEVDAREALLSRCVPNNIAQKFVLLFSE